MRGLMQDWPLLCHRIIDHAALNHAERCIHSRSVEGPMVTTTYGAIRTRALKVAKRLDRDGIKLGDRVATLAWNTARHLEAWYGILGIGAVYHTVNPRLFPEQIAWIINNAEDRIVLVDLTFVPLMEALADRLPTVERCAVVVVWLSCSVSRRRAPSGRQKKKNPFSQKSLGWTRSTAITTGRNS